MAAAAPAFRPRCCLIRRHFAADGKAALAQAEWLASHRGRAYVEYAVERMLMPFNVAQSDLALLRAAELAHALGDSQKSKRSLDAFLEAWPSAENLDFVSARLKPLESANRAPPGGS